MENCFCRKRLGWEYKRRKVNSALLEACQRSWPEAMYSLLCEYHEVIEEQSPPMAA
jgi:hypothetical protein